VVLFALVLPFLIQLGISFKAGNDNVHKTMCVYFTAIGITAALTNVIKFYVGYLRPTFMQGCEPDENYEYCTSGNDREMRLSFPSGHASLSFCGLGALSFYLEMRYGITGSRILLYDKPSGEMLMGYNQPVRYRRIVTILCYIPMVIAGFIASSRLVDNMHFPADVIGGTLLGASVAWLSHGTW
jgi:diacylglycerol diphosphate phosphatase/phosphatidate phosphatase